MAQLCEAVDKTHSAFYYYWVRFGRQIEDCADGR